MSDGSRRSSAISGFYRLSVEARRELLAEQVGLSQDVLDTLSSDSGLRDDQANRMVENVLGVMGLPLGLCVNLMLNGRDYLVPMAIEEPSVVAAASFASKLLRAGGGVEALASPAHMVGQVQLMDVGDADRATRLILASKSELLALANSGHPTLISVGGGALDVEVHALPKTEANDPCGDMLVVHLIVDVCDAMGANAINSMCERIAPRIVELVGGRAGLRILSNLSDRRLVKVRGRVPLAALEGRGRGNAIELARGIVEASVFAERDPYRAATHNKGIMNGIDSVLLAFGQDFRAVEAGAHAYAARSGRYTALARWRLESGALVGELEVPMAVGTVGGVARVHPTVQVVKAIAAIETASELASVVAAVGLAQNLSALRALAAEGIQKGHMRLHARNVAVEAGAAGDDVDEIAATISGQGKVNLGAAKAALEVRREGRREASTIPPIYRGVGEVGARDLLLHFKQLRDAHWPAMVELQREVVRDTTAEDSTLGSMFDYHIDTGGKRLRALLPLMVAEALGKDAVSVLPFGAACEMLHNATLVHDDLQDGDLIRRGQLTVWNKFGIPQAINLGDAMFYYAIALCHRVEVPVKLREATTKRMLHETIRVIDGQEREFSLKSLATLGLADYFTMVEGKTSGLFALPMCGAAHLSEASNEVVAGLEESARHMGVLFQIQDDTLDLYGDKGRESRGSDIGEGKRSVLVVHALEQAKDDDAARLRAILDADRDATSDADVQWVLSLFKRTKTLEFAIAEMQRRQQAALAVSAVAKHPRLASLVAAMCELFLEPIRSLLG